MLMAPSASLAADPTVAGSEKSPRTGWIPAALNFADDASLRARAATSWPAARRRSATTLPMYPVAPVRNTFILAHPQQRETGTSTESYHHGPVLRVLAPVSRPWTS